MNSCIHCIHNRYIYIYIHKCQWTNNSANYVYQHIFWVSRGSSFISAKLRLINCHLDSSEACVAELIRLVCLASLEHPPFVDGPNGKHHGLKTAGFCYSKSQGNWKDGFIWLNFVWQAPFGSLAWKWRFSQGFRQVSLQVCTHQQWVDPLVVWPMGNPQFQQVNEKVFVVFEIKIAMLDIFQTCGHLYSLEKHVDFLVCWHQRDSTQNEKVFSDGIRSLRVIHVLQILSDQLTLYMIVG